MWMTKLFNNFDRGCRSFKKLRNTTDYWVKRLEFFIYLRIRKCLQNSHQYMLTRVEVQQKEWSGEMQTYIFLFLFQGRECITKFPSGKGILLKQFS